MLNEQNNAGLIRTVIFLSIGILLISLILLGAGIYYGAKMYLAWEKAELEKSKTGLTKTSKYDIKDTAAYLKRGGISGNNYDKAIADCTKIIELDPRNARAYYGRGWAYEKKGEWDKAIADYSKIIELEPENALAYQNRGLAYESTGKLDKAITDYTKVIGLDSKNAQAYCDRGYVYYDKNKFSRAVADLEKCLELNPKIDDAEQIRQDIAKIKKLKDFFAPQEAEAYYGDGLCHSRWGDYDKAIADFSMAIKIDPKFARAYYGRGWAYEKKGEWDKAIADYSKAIEFDPENSDAYYGRGLTYGKKNRLKEAIADLEKCLELNPKIDDAERISWDIAKMKAAQGLTSQWVTLIDDFSHWERRGNNRAEIYIGDDDGLYLKSGEGQPDSTFLATLVKCDDLALEMEFKVITGSLSMTLKDRIPVDFPYRPGEEWQKCALELKGDWLSINSPDNGTEKKMKVDANKPGPVTIELKPGAFVIIRKLRIKKP